MPTDNQCGVWGFYPSCLRRFATTKAFIVVFGLLGTIQAMAFVYFVATITTLEKRFQMPSQTMGILMSGNEISQIALVLFLSHFGGKGNRPRWIAWGVAVSALSSFILALPHLIYGPGQAALALTAEHLDIEVFNASEGTGDKNPFTCNAARHEKECSEGDLNKSLVPMILLFTSQFVLGIGTALYFSIGQTYLDDNTKKTQTPMLLGVTMSLRTLGPAGGFILGSLCLSLYIDPTLTPLIARRDPRWLGAWWLGWIILGSVMLVFAFLLSAFPKTLPKKKEQGILENARTNAIYQEKISAEKKPLTGDSTKNAVGDTFRSSLKRILTNKIIAANNFTAVFYILGASGYMTFYNKYTETQFGASAAHSNATAAITILFSLVSGFLISGYVISRWKPGTKFLLGWNIMIGCVYCIGEFSIMFLGCPESNLIGTITENQEYTPKAFCNADCVCDSIKYTPVCHLPTQQTYFSACHAGCTEMQLGGSGMRTFSNCACVDAFEDTLVQGGCPVDCGSSFYLFMAIVCLMQMIGCTGRITNILINYRAVLPQDKTLAQGFALFLISLFAFIPGPIIYGKIIDSACLVWDNTCGDKGNCWLYDKEDFRVLLNSTAVGFSFCATIMDVVLFFLARNLNLYKDNDSKASR